MPHQRSFGHQPVHLYNAFIIVSCGIHLGTGLGVANMSHQATCNLSSFHMNGQLKPALLTSPCSTAMHRANPK